MSNVEEKKMKKMQDEWLLSNKVTICPEIKGPGSAVSTTVADIEGDDNFEADIENIEDIEDIND